jgi:hypothetical protein
MAEMLDRLGNRPVADVPESPAQALAHERRRR